MPRRTLIARAIAGLLPVSAAIVMVASDNPTLKMRDDCDPTTFNQIIGPGTCSAKLGGDTTFQAFIAEFQKEGSVDEWEFSEDHATLDRGAVLKLSNRGGETHTFTQVAQFGGGFVPALVKPGQDVAPECLAMFGPDGKPVAPTPMSQFVPSGGTANGPVAGLNILPGQTVKFQCCIHPWMHTTVTVK